MDRALRQALEQFALEHGFDDLESIRMALSLTRHAKRFGLPISEGEIAALEHEALCARPASAMAPTGRLTLRMSSSPAIREAVRSLVAQAPQRAGAAGKSLVGALLYHLAGATLDCVLGTGAIEHSAFGTADPSGTRIGDYLIDDVAIHVTSSPSEALIKRCGQDLSNGIRPIVITLARHLPAAEVLADYFGVHERVEFFEIEQFVALSAHGLSRFGSSRRSLAIESIIARYNEIVAQVEPDPSLRIELQP